jgi:hypothetical protein
MTNNILISCNICRIFTQINREANIPGAGVDDGTGTTYTYIYTSGFVTASCTNMRIEQYRTRMKGCVTELNMRRSLVFQEYFAFPGSGAMADKGNLIKWY